MRTADMGSRAQKEQGGLENTIRNSIPTPMQDARDARHQWNHAKIPTHQKNTRKPIKDMMNLKRGSLTNMKQQHTRSQELLERQHTTRTAAAASDEAQILEQQHATIATAVANEETEIIEQHTAVTARKEETIDSIDQELLALMNKTTEIISGIFEHNRWTRLMVQIELLRCHSRTPASAVGGMRL